MTISEVINQVDALHRNTFDFAQKVAWLSQVDSTVQRKILDLYVGSEDHKFTGYTAETPGDTVLLMPAPFDAAYKHFLSAQIHLAQQELDKYNNEMGMYYADYDDYDNWYRRTHSTKSHSRFLF